MRITKAVITAAARNQRTLPLQYVVDRDGVPKSVLRIIVEEVLAAGIEEIALVICPGDAPAYREAAGDQAARLQCIEQPEPRGYGHAIFCAREFTGSAPFLHLVSDHLSLSRSPRRCAQQLVEVASAEACAVSAVQPSRESQLRHYGTLGGHQMADRSGLYVVEHVIEKPTPTQAEQQLMVPGLRVGHYLCFFGMHVLTPAVMDILAEHVVATGPHGSVQLSPALEQLAGRERYLALVIEGQRHDVGVTYGLLMAQLALALDGTDRDEVLAQLVELLALRSR